MSQQSSHRQNGQMAPAGGRIWLNGWRLHTMTCGILLTMMLVNIEVSIVGTSLVSIVQDLDGFSQSGLIVAAYLTSYASLLIIWCKISDVFGRKPAMIGAQVIFGAFSGGCGAAQSMVQLASCRAIQGVGAAGCQALGILLTYEMVPSSKYPLYGGFISASIALGSLTGPVIGGGLSQYSTWRWAFLINVPATSFVLFLLFVSMPTTFPYAGSSPSPQLRFNPQKLLQLDLVGSSLLLVGTYVLVTVLLDAGTTFGWSSATSIVLLTISGIAWVAFLSVEWSITRYNWKTQPIFPWRFLGNRAWMGTLLSSLFSGAPHYVLVVILPQRFQITNGLSALDAGVRLIPFNALISFGSVIVSGIAAKTKIAPLYLLVIGSVLQLAGIVPMAYLPGDGNLHPSIYGCQILSGLGIGFNYGVAVLLPPLLVEMQDLAVATGALIQFRIFGGAIGLAIGSSVANNYLESRLKDLIGSAGLSNLIDSFQHNAGFSKPERALIEEAFAHSFSLETKVLIAFAAAQFAAIALLWHRPQILFLNQKKAESSVENSAEKNDV